MSIFHDSALIGSGGGAVAYQINQSLRFDGSAYLSRSLGTTSSSWTVSFWTKTALNDNNDGYWFNTSQAAIYMDSSSGAASDRRYKFRDATSGSLIVSNAVIRDPSAWYHVVYKCDGSNRRLYVNNSLDAGFTYSGSTTLSGSSAIGAYYTGSGSQLEGYIAEFHFADGTALDPSSFAELDTITGAWIPKKYTGSYGSQGFYLKFDPSATNGIGHDHSGNGNNFTATGFSTSGTGTDVMSDTPTNNYATLNPIYLPTNMTIADGNLYFQPTATNWYLARSNFGVNSGKWYCEMKLSANNGCRFALTARENNDVRDTNAICYNHTGTIEKYASTVVSASSWGVGDVMGMAVDAGAGTCAFYKNGTLQGTVTGLDTTLTWFPAVDAYSSSTYGYWNFGQRAFEQTQPSGFKAWNTANLPEPTIKKGSKYFDTKLYTGNSTGGAATQTLTGFGFSPDFVWIKGRASSTANHSLFDQVRGTGKVLWSQSTNQEETNYSRGYLSAFTSDGFTVTTGSTDGRDVNGLSTGSPPDTYVAWAWDANGAGSSNTAGSITSTVSANATAGFSIVTYTGAGSNGTVGHGLGVAPKFLIVKNRSSATAYNWYVWHAGLTSASYFLNLNRDIAQTFSADPFNGTAPTSTVFSVGGENRVSSVNYVAYCFSEVAGYSKFGSYTGNGSSNGPFVFCGFRPRWLLVKRTGGADDWFMYDTARDTFNEAWRALDANTTDVEKTSNTIPVDILSNGFKIRSSGTAMNGSGETIVFAAFAELPFKYSTAR